MYEWLSHCIKHELETHVENRFAEFTEEKVQQISVGVLSLLTDYEISISV